MSLPTVSLVMLYKDREAQVVKTLESIVDQRYEPLEIIVVEDGDDGGTISAIAKFYGARHLRVSREAPVESGRSQYYTKNPPFGNLPVLRNKGIAAATCAARGEGAK
jgi:glycosyltransferase involved in cell wall biosynthesis